MLVSIITPTFNSERYLEDTYKSLCSQTYTNWEWLVTDDCSDDDSWSILSRIAESDKRVSIFKNIKNSGAAITRNNSLSNAKGDFIAFLDSDDLWLPNKLEQQLNFMLRGVDFSFTAYQLMDSSGNLTPRKVDTLQMNPISYIDMLKKKATIGCSTVMLRRAAFQGLLEMPLLRTGQDYALWLKILKTGAVAFPLNIVLTHYRVVSGSISRNKFKKACRQWQIYRELEHLPLFFACECFFFYALRAVFKP